VGFPIYYNGKILFRNGKPAFSRNCCCGQPCSGGFNFSVLIVGPYPVISDIDALLGIIPLPEMIIVEDQPAYLFFVAIWVDAEVGRLYAKYVTCQQGVSLIPFNDAGADYVQLLIDSTDPLLYGFDLISFDFTGPSNCSDSVGGEIAEIDAIGGNTRIYSRTYSSRCPN